MIVMFSGETVQTILADSQVPSNSMTIVSLGQNGWDVSYKNDSGLTLLFAKLFGITITIQKGT